MGLFHLEEKGQRPKNILKNVPKKLQKNVPKKLQKNVPKKLQRLKKYNLEEKQQKRKN